MTIEQQRLKFIMKTDRRHRWMKIMIQGAAVSNGLIAIATTGLVLAHSYPTVAHRVILLVPLVCLFTLRGMQKDVAQAELEHSDFKEICNLCDRYRTDAIRIKAGLLGIISRKSSTIQGRLWATDMLQTIRRDEWNRKLKELKPL